MLLEKGDPQAAEGHARAAVEIFRELFPEDHPQFTSAVAVLADCLAALGP